MSGITEKMQECLHAIGDLQVCAEFLLTQDRTIDNVAATRQLAQELARRALDLEKLTIP